MLYELLLSTVCCLHLYTTVYTTVYLYELNASEIHLLAILRNVKGRRCMVDFVRLYNQF